MKRQRARPELSGKARPKDLKDPRPTQRHRQPDSVTCSCDHRQAHIPVRPMMSSSRACLAIVHNFTLVSVSLSLLGAPRLAFRTRTDLALGHAATPATPARPPRPPQPPQPVSSRRNPYCMLSPYRRCTPVRAGLRATHMSTRS